MSKTNLCFKCNRSNNLLLCRNCIKNPFWVEDLRNNLATQKNYHLLFSTYTKNYTEITNINTPKFWNNNFSIFLSLKKQDEMTKEKINNVISFIPKRTKRVLDLGIGQGYLEERLKALNISYELHGIDISINAIKKARKKFKGEFKVSNVFKIGKLYKKGFFNTIIALELLEHIPPSKIFLLLKEIYLILKPNGIFIISIPINEHLRDKKENISGHIREYTISIIEAELILSGFKVINKKELYAFKNFYKAKNLLAKILKNRWEANNVVIKAVKI